MSSPASPPSPITTTTKALPPILLLPPELRLQIYTFILSAPSLLPPQTRRYRHARLTTLSLLLVNKLIHREYAPCFHSSFVYKVQINPDGPFYFSSPDVTKSSPLGLRAEVLRGMRRWVVEVFLGGGKRDDDEEEEDDDEDEDGDDYDERGKEKGRREMERERERTRGWMNVRTWFRGWCVKILDAGVEVESLEVRVFGAGLGGVGLSEGEVGMDLLAPVREVRAKKCVVEIGEGEGKVGEEERRYGDRVAELVMGREGEIEPKPHRLLTEIESFAKSIRTTTEAFDPTLPDASHAKRKAQAALCCIDFDIDLSLQGRVKQLHEAYTLVSQHASLVKENLEEKEFPRQAPAVEEKKMLWKEVAEAKGRLEKLEKVEQMREWFHIRPEFRDAWPGGAPNIFQDWRPVGREEAEEVVEPWVAE